MEITYAEKLAALAEIIRDTIPCDESKVSEVKSCILLQFEKAASLCHCKSEHEAWIQALLEINLSLKEIVKVSIQ